MVSRAQSTDIPAIVDAVSADRIEADIRTLAGFGTATRSPIHESDTRGIGAARRWIKAEFDRISEACGGCLEVFYQRSSCGRRQPAASRRTREVVNVVAILRGHRCIPNRYVIMSGDIDSRASNGTDGMTRCARAPTTTPPAWPAPSRPPAC